jgi:DNA-binding NtrC family response regulator
VRELENVVERTVSLAPGPLIMPDDLPEAVRKAEADPAGGNESLLSLDEVEKRHLNRVLRETDGNKVRAAKILGIDRRTLYRMAERFGMDLGEESAE